ncbi:APC family permease [Streptomyces sp. LHD-70]|uniref:APC family permease n=1 Tax=Streptomyces sp. LHD-70 TaxID=3072140 RepID=UPI00280D9652|nr:APC family permease [Streptomyces sp. LHD-70]MDQ8705144.1 APC family permease [Streptomyces sp. LHD-70]
MTQPLKPALPDEGADGKLRRTMTLQQVLFLAISGQIGSGWLFAVLTAAGVSGPAAILSWVIGGAIITLIALAWMEVGAALPRSGAIVRYPYLTHGGLTGWIMGFTYWIANLSLPAIEALAVLTYLSGSFPELGLLEVKDGVSVLAWPNGILAGIALMAFFYLVNIFGVRLLSEANRWVTWWKILVPIATFLLLFFTFNSSNFTATGLFPMGGGSVFETVAISGIAFTLTSFRGVLDFSGEVVNPKRTIPLGTIGCILIPLAIYVLLQVAFIGAVSWSDAGVGVGDWAALAGSSWADGPLVHALRAASIGALGAFATVLLIDAVVSPGASGYVFLGVTARVGFGLSIHGYFPKAFQKTNKHGVPWVSTVVSFVMGCLFFAPSPSWARLAGFISTAMVLSALMAAVCLPVMRRYAPDLQRPFVLRQAGFWAPAGFCAAAALIYWAGFETLVNITVLVFGGLVVYGAHYGPFRGWTGRGAGVGVSLVYFVAWCWVTARGGWFLATNDQAAEGSWTFPLYCAVSSVLIVAYYGVLWLLSNGEGRRHLGSGLWLVVLLLGTLPLSYYGEFGPGAAWAFPVGTLLETALALAVYYWAVAVGFATEELKEAVALEIHRAEVEAQQATAGEGTAVTAAK